MYKFTLGISVKEPVSGMLVNYAKVKVSGTTAEIAKNKAKELVTTPGMDYVYTARVLEVEEL